MQHCVGGAWHTAIRTDTGDNYVMGCILPAGDLSRFQHDPQTLRSSVYNGGTIALLLQSALLPTKVISCSNCFYFPALLFVPAESGDESNPAPLTAPRNELNRRSSRATATGAATPSDPFALSYGGFRRLMLPRGSEACSKGHSLFYGPGLGAPPGALRKVQCSVLCCAL